MDINLIGPVSKLGYGVATINILESLYLLDNKVSFFPINNNIDCEDRYLNILKQTIINAQKFNIHSPSIRIWHQHQMDMFPGKGERIGFPFFELNNFTEIEKHHLSSLDRIFVASNWAKNILLDNNINPHQGINVVPLGVNREIFKPGGRTRDNFTTFFTIGKWEVRKGHDVLIECFSKAFNENDNVSLMMMCHNPFLNELQLNQWLNRVKDSKLGNKIKIIPYTATQKELVKYINSCDCGVFISRAEGWNLDLLESMSCGKQVIATDCTAHSEYINENNSLTIKMTEMEEAYDGQFFFRQGNWFSHNADTKDQIISHMRSIHKRKIDGDDLFNNNGVYTAEAFSWNNSAKMMISYL